MNFGYNYEDNGYSDTDMEFELTMENAHTIDDKIIIIENIINEIRDDISNIWYDIISPYIDNNGQVLNKLYKCNVSKYIKFICQNNEEYKKLTDELHYLYRIQGIEYKLQEKNIIDHIKNRRILLFINK